MNKHGEKIAVHIVTNGDKTVEKIVGDGESGLYFPAEEAVVTSSEVNNTFDHLLKQSATIRFLSRDYIPDFFAKNCRDVVVNIFKGSECVFAGYVTPRTYSQDYNELYDEIELNCIDCLSALEYSNYKEIGSAGHTYAAAQLVASNRTFYDVVKEILEGITSDLVIDSGAVSFLYDATKGINANSLPTVFKDISIADTLFLDDDEDSVWTQEEILNEILQYLNLHITQVGFRFFIFDWSSVKNTASITWYSLEGTETDITTRSTVEISNDNVADVGTSISIEDVFNVLSLECSMDDVENIIESPMDDDYIEPVFKSCGLYMREYMADGDGETAQNSMASMLLGKEENTTYEGAVITDWYLRVKNNSLWSFRYDDTTDIYSKFYPNNGGIGDWQEDAPNYLGQNIDAVGNMGAMLLSFAKSSHNMAKKDNSTEATLSYNDYLMVAVNDCRMYKRILGVTVWPSKADEEAAADALATRIKAACPLVTYKGSNIVNLTPSDNNTKNYIVISGKITLVPYSECDGYADALKEANLGSKNFNTYGYKDDKSVRMLTRAFYKTSTNLIDNSRTVGVVPYDSDNELKVFKFNYSSVGDSTDKLSKVQILQCMLVIGDMCAVESESSNGALSDITWQKYKELSECEDEDEYYQQSFSIGFNPAIDDYIIGKEYDVQNNIDFTLNIDAEGTAIPIEYSDKLHGKVQFKILGVVNSMWDVITRRHPTFFRHTKWTTTARALMSYVRTVFIKDFEVKVYSDNGKINTENDDNDVIYMSDTDEQYVNKKDDINFKICSALTSSECAEMGVTTGVKKCTPIANNAGLQQIYDKENACLAKAEQLYVDAYWNEYHTPKVLMEQNFEDTGSTVSLFNHYTHPAMGKEFYVQGIDRDLMEGTANVKLKEC